MSTSAFLNVCVVFTCCLVGVFACKCRQPTKETTCMADYVIKAEVGETKPGVTGATFLEKAYKLLCISSYYKLSGARITEMELNGIYTANHSAACGSSFTPGREYVLSGNIDKRTFPYKFGVDTCTYNKLWEEVTKEEIVFLKNPICLL